MNCASRRHIYCAQGFRVHAVQSSLRKPLTSGYLGAICKLHLLPAGKRVKGQIPALNLEYGDVTPATCSLTSPPGAVAKGDYNSSLEEPGQALQGGHVPRWRGEVTSSARRVSRCRGLGAAVMKFSVKENSSNSSFFFFNFGFIRMPCSDFSFFHLEDGPKSYHSVLLHRI